MDLKKDKDREKYLKNRGKIVGNHGLDPVVRKGRKGLPRVD